MNLATFIQISDLHFGNLDISDLDSNNIWWKRLLRIQGFLGHGSRYIKNLAKVFGDLKRTEDAQLIVTGDLTTCGKAVEFNIVELYLGAIPPSRQMKHLGLQTPNWKRTAISGNHDQWPGHCSLVGNANPTVYAWFYDLPRISPIVRLSSGHDLRFLWIDSDVDVGSFSLTRALARGSYCSQLKELDHRLSAPTEKEIRVLAVHHSPTYAANLRQRKELEIDSRTRKELQKFIIAHNISVVLCGHMHNPPFVQVCNATHSGRSLDFLEARCGSTTQAQFDDLKSHEKTQVRVRGLKTPKETNSLLVHRLIEDAGSIFWETEILLDDLDYYRKPSSVTLPNGQLVTTRFKVWP